MQPKGLICAGGEATRLGELTRVANKHLLPVGSWPMIYYPLHLLQLAGITDVLITNQVVEPAKLARLPALASQARIGICADDSLHISRLSEAFAGTGREIDLYVEINVVKGGGRC